MMTLTPKGYLPRLIDEKLTIFLKTFGAISIEGPKWCGKTWAARNQCNSEFQLNSNNLSLLQIDAGYAFDGATPRLIDEWQDFPSLWDEVRFEVDRSSEKGRFVLCGSSALDVKIKKHTGAGRIGTVHMNTMSLYESGDSYGEVSLNQLFEGCLEPTKMHEVSLETIIKLTIRGGWPGLLDVSDPKVAIADYIEKLCEEDISKVDGRARNPYKMKMLLKSLARNESTIVNDSSIRKDMMEYDNETIGDTTIDDYKSVLQKLNILWYQPSFSTNLRSSARIGKSPKKHLADPSLAMSLLNMDEKRALNDIKTFGFIFESLCERDLKIYSEYNGYSLFHYRDAYGDEIDAVVERPDGSWGAFEIKLGFNQVDVAAKNLIEMIDKFDRKPDFLCVLCGTAPAAFKRPDGVYVVPITSLKP